MDSCIPDKIYFKIGEVAQLIGVKASVLRFWENEFTVLKPEKSKTGQRLYTVKEVELIKEVKRLLYTEKYTIEGVKKQLTHCRKNSIKKAHFRGKSKGFEALLREIKSDLLILRCQL